VAPPQQASKHVRAERGSLVVQASDLAFGQRCHARQPGRAAAADGWRGLFIDNPAIASWRTAAAAAHAALGHREQAAALVSEQLVLARKTADR
jgi:hypothetical protein